MTQWPFGGGPAGATWPQLVLLLEAQRQEDTTVKKKMPKRLWQDWLKRLGHGTG